MLDHVLLALLTDRPSSGYELKARIDGDLDPLWTAELSQIYPALARLQRAGYLSLRVRGPERGPASHRYRATARGRRELARWFADPPRPPRLRDESLTRLLLIEALASDRLAEALRLYELALAEEMVRIKGKLPGRPPASAVRQLSLSRLDALRRSVRTAASRPRRRGAPL